MNLTAYQGLVSGEINIPSGFMILLNGGAEAPGISYISRKVEERFQDKVSVIPAPERAGPGGQWHLDVTITEDEEKFEYGLWLEHSETLHEELFDKAGFSDEESAGANTSEWAIGINASFDGEPIADYHRQLKVINAMDLNPPAVYDLSACELHPGSWIKEVAEAETHPSPENLFSVHVIQDDDRPGVWLHTHGLLRCGCFELEMVGVDPENAEAMHSLLRFMATLFLSYEPPAPDKHFEPIPGMKMVWLPLFDGLRKVSQKTFGQLQDRDQIHLMPSAILMGKKGFWPFRQYYCADHFTPMMEDNPLVGVSADETIRMSKMANERFKEFKSFFVTFAEDEEWSFLVKLGYKVDKAEDEQDREHLWFRVKNIEDSQFEAELINQPYYIERMQEGDTMWHEIDKLTDWNIMCHHGTFSPDTISLLKKELEKKNKPTE